MFPFFVGGLYDNNELQTSLMMQKSGKFHIVSQSAFKVMSKYTLLSS